MKANYSNIKTRKIFGKYIHLQIHLPGGKNIVGSLSISVTGYIDVRKSLISKNISYFFSI